METTKTLNLFADDRKTNGLFWYIKDYNCLSYAWLFVECEGGMKFRIPTHERELDEHVKEARIKLNIENIPPKIVADAINGLLEHANKNEIEVWFI